MKIRKKIEIRLFLLVIVTLLIWFSSPIVNINAKDTTEVIVEYTPSEEAIPQYKMKVYIEGDGYLLDGDQRISKPPKVYELAAGTRKYFQVVPENGATLLRAVYDGVDITDNVKSDNRIIVKSKDKDSVLKVIFTINNEKSVSTGDDKGMGRYIVIMAIFVFAMYVFIRNKKVQKEK